MDLHCTEYARGMIRSLFAATLAVSLIIFPQTIATAADDSTVHQIGTFDYLVQPDFTGLQQADKVTDHATLGLGTFANLDGELVMVGGVAYRVPTTGIPERITGKELTPFVQAINFTPTKSGPVPPRHPVQSAHSSHQCTRRNRSGDYCCSGPRNVHAVGSTQCSQARTTLANARHRDRSTNPIQS